MQIDGIDTRIAGLSGVGAKSTEGSPRFSRLAKDLEKVSPNPVDHELSISTLQRKIEWFNVCFEPHFTLSAASSDFRN